LSVRAPRLAGGVALLALLLGLGACAPGSDGGAEPDAQGEVEPLIDRDFPDPDVLAVDGTYYAFATNGNAKNVQVAQSTDLQTWELLPDDALPQLPGWIIPGKTWAPEVTRLESGTFAMYFTATNYRPARQCIGVATSDVPTGPFAVQGEGMLVCPAEEGGAIDASTFADGGQLYLVWKNDGNCCGLDTWISAAPLTADGLGLAGEPTRLFKQTLEWEGDLVEAPTLIEHDGQYVAFYSANSYSDDRYAVGYATAETVTGPWTKSEQPFLATDTFDGDYRGPGGQDVITTADGETFLAFHGWDPAFTYRGMYVEPLTWEGDRPELVPD
jgi:GH43 family beta-xylosidase